MYFVLSMAKPGATSAKLKLARLDLGDDGRPLGGQHTLDEVLVPAQFGPVVAPHRFVEVRRPCVVERVGQIKHPVMRVGVQHLKRRRILRTGVAAGQFGVELVLPTAWAALNCSSNLNTPCSAAKMARSAGVASKGKRLSIAVS